MLLIAHNIRSLHNVGAIFRSADAFGVNKVYLTGITGTPPRKEIAKVALGAEQRIDWEYRENTNDLLAELQSSGTHIIALEQDPRAIPLSKDVKESEGEVAVLIGNEVEGIEKPLLDAADAIIEIPMPGQKKSLNVSVATGIILFALTVK